MNNWVEGSVSVGSIVDRENGWFGRSLIVWVGVGIDM